MNMLGCQTKILMKVMEFCSVGRMMVLFGCFILPVMCIYLFNSNIWIGRLIGVFIAFSIGIPACFFYSLNPKIKYIKENAKLYNNKKASFFVEAFFRLLFFICGFIFCKSFYVPMIMDIVDGVEHPRIIGEVAHITEPFPLLEFFSQELQVNYKGRRMTCYFLYPLQTRLEENTKYDFVILPRSNLILDARLSENSTK